MTNRHQKSRTELGALMLGEAIGTAARFAVDWYFAKYILFPIIIGLVLVAALIFGPNVGAFALLAIVVGCVLWIVRAGRRRTVPPRTRLCALFDYVLLVITAVCVVSALMGADWRPLLLGCLTWIVSALIAREREPAVEFNAAMASAWGALTPLYEQAEAKAKEERDELLRQFFEAHGMGIDFETFVHTDGMNEKLKKFLATDPGKQELVEFVRKIVAEQKKRVTGSCNAVSTPALTTCTNCQHKNPESYQLCGGCGAAVARIPLKLPKREVASPAPEQTNINKLVQLTQEALPQQARESVTQTQHNLQEANKCWEQVEQQVRDTALGCEITQGLQEVNKLWEQVCLELTLGGGARTVQTDENINMLLEALQEGNRLLVSTLALLASAEDEQDRG